MDFSFSNMLYDPEWIPEPKEQTGDTGERKSYPGTDSLLKSLEEFGKSKIKDAFEKKSWVIRFRNEQQWAFSGVGNDAQCVFAIVCSEPGEYQMMKLSCDAYPQVIKRDGSWSIPDEYRDNITEGTQDVINNAIIISLSEQETDHE